MQNAAKTHHLVPSFDWTNAAGYSMLVSTGYEPFFANTAMVYTGL